MKIERLELVGYKRLMLSNIHRFDYTPESIYQIILGTNGSGKSSILFELSPLPAQSQYYVKDGSGSKVVTLSHRGHHYVCQSTFKNGNRHSFLKDGEELNPGGTGQIQKELVEKEFGLTQELHEILIGENRFTEMSPQHRRQWVTALSNVDYRYGLTVFQKMKSQWRDRLGVLKHLKQRLSIETNNLMSLNMDVDIVQRESVLHGEITSLLTARVPDVPQYQEAERVWIEKIAKAHSTAKDAKRVISVLMIDKTDHSSIELLKEDIKRLDEEISGLTAIIDRDSKEFDDLKSVAQSMGYGDVDIPEDLDALIAEKMESIGLLSSSDLTFSSFDDPLASSKDYETILPDLIELFASLPDNTDRRYSKEVEEETRKRLDAFTKEFDILDTKLRLTRRRLNDVQSAKDSTCPKCSYVWKEGYSEGELTRLQNDLEVGGQQVSILEDKMRVQKQFLDEITEYSNQCRRFRNFVNSFPRLRSLWDYIVENKFLTNQPKSRINTFHLYRADLRTACQIFERKQELEKLISLKQRRDFQRSHADPKLRLESIERNIEHSMEKRHALKKRRDHLQKLALDHEMSSEYIRELDVIEGELQTALSALVSSIRNDEIDVLVRQHQNELGNLQHQINSRKNLESIVNDLTKSLQDSVQDYEVLTLLTKALSPTEGFIAEQMSGFIRCFTDQLNSIISSIWTYGLTVLPCGMESGELSYKFPLQINTAENIVVDIQKGSKAQKEVVNFAFILTVMLYLGLQEHPLYLDEIGEGFDEQHRENAMNFIKHLIDIGQYSQTFLISHHMSSWSVFQGAQHLVLDGTNIAVPDHVNEHVIFG